MPVPDDTELTMREIAEREGVSLRTVKRWKAAGQLPEPKVSVSPGGRKRYTWRESDLPLQYELPLDV